MANESKVVATTTKKDLDEMSAAHRAKIERWEPHLAKLGTSAKSPAHHVWAQSPRFVGRGEGEYWMLVKVGARDYRIGSYDTSNPKRIVFEEGAKFESPKAALEAFKPYRAKAKTERDAARKAAREAKSKSVESGESAKPKAKRIAKPKSA